MATLTVDSAENGKIEVYDGETLVLAPFSFDVKVAKKLTLKAVADEGCSFKNWTGASTATAPTIEIVIDGDKTIGAEFVSGVLLTTLTVTAPENGTIKVEEGTTILRAPYTVNKDTILTVTAVPTDGYMLDRWTGDRSGASSKLSITMDTDVALGAVFKVPPAVAFFVRVNANEHGAISVTDPSGKNVENSNVQYGLELTVTASPNDGFKFLKWTGDVAGAVPETTVPVNGALEISCEFISATTVIRTLTVEQPAPETGCNIVVITADKSILTEPYRVVDGTVLTLKVDSEQAAQEFSAWTGTLSGVMTKLATIIMDDDKAVGTTLKIKEHTLTIGAFNSSHGRVEVRKKGDPTLLNIPYTFPHGTVLVVKAIAETGYGFKEWDSSRYGLLSEVEFSLDYSFEYTPIFKPVFTVSVTTNSNATVYYTYEMYFDSPDWIEITTSSIDIFGGFIMYKADVAEGYAFSKWVGGAGNVVTGANERDLKLFISSNSDYTVGVETVALGSDVTLTVTEPDAGSIIIKDINDIVLENATSYTVPANTILKVSYEGDSASDKDFEAWTGDLSGVNRQMTILMDAARSVGVMTKVKTFEINLTQGSFNGVAVTFKIQEADNPPVQFFTGGSTSYSGTFPIRTKLTLTAEITSDHEVVWARSWPTSEIVGVPWVIDSLDSDYRMTVNMVPMFELSLSSLSNGAIEVYEEGDLATLISSPYKIREGGKFVLKPVPVSGHGFSAWTGANTGKDIPLTLTMDGAKTIGATFQLQVNNYALIINPVVQNGQIEVKKGDQPVLNLSEIPELSVLTVTAVPDPGYGLTGWTFSPAPITPVDTDQLSFSLVMDGNKTLSATFAKKWETVASLAGDGEMYFASHCVFEGVYHVLTAKGVKKLTGSTWSDVGTPLATGTDVLISTNIAVLNNELYILYGLAPNINSKGVPNLAKWTGSSWSAIALPSSLIAAGDEFGGMPWNLGMDNDGTLYIAIPQIEENASPVSVKVRIFKYSGDSWTEITFSDSTYMPSSKFYVLNGTPYFMNYFDESAFQVFQYDGGKWNALGDPIVGFLSNSLAMDGAGNLYFSGADDGVSVSIFQWIDGQWSKVVELDSGTQSVATTFYNGQMVVVLTSSPGICSYKLERGELVPFGGDFNSFFTFDRSYGSSSFFVNDSNNKLTVAKIGRFAGDPEDKIYIFEYED